MANMSLTKTPIAEQEPKVRARNFKEVTLGYTPEQAIEEAQRCLNCKHKPCMTGCPVSVRIPEFIAKVAEASLKRLMLSSKQQTLCRLFADVYVHRSISVRASV